MSALDKVIRAGEVIDVQSDDPSMQGVRRMHEIITGDPRRFATALEAVRSMGWDGASHLSAFRSAERKGNISRFALP